MCHIREIKYSLERKDRNLPYCNRSWLVNHTIGLTISISNKELQSNIYKKSYLSNNVQNKEILRKATKKTKLHWGEEGRVHCPEQYKYGPQPIPPAFLINHLKFKLFTLRNY